MKEELPCGCTVGDEYEGSQFSDNPTLKIQPCEDHDRGYIYMGYTVFNAEY